MSLHPDSPRFAHLVAGVPIAELAEAANVSEPTALRIAEGHALPLGIDYVALADRLSLDLATVLYLVDEEKRAGLLADADKPEQGLPVFDEIREIQARMGSAQQDTPRFDDPLTLAIIEADLAIASLDEPVEQRKRRSAKRPAN